ncbi:MAG: acetyl-CoA carboxylase biotin carboxylase subunit, partial [Zetaproteobacteria bacterium]
MFQRMLIANRGECAVRLIRACQELGIETVAIYSEADAHAVHVKKADRAVMIGPDPVRSYLNIHRIVDIALEMKADAVHPGYGFLSENADFAEAVLDAGLVWVGPRPEAIRAMGDKTEARRTMQAHDVPVVPGSDGPVETLDEALRLADAFGYPVMLKAAAGGGGRGIRRCDDAESLRANYELVRREAKAAFGDDAVFLEKCIVEPRHIEFQILADRHGQVVHLFERDCSIQRRHQKLIEIAPSLFLDEKLRAEMGEVAVRAGRAVSYENAGTVEFLVDRDRRFYFMEMNTRLQVEHPITEAITGIDLVEMQIR